MFFSVHIFSQQLHTLTTKGYSLLKKTVVDAVYKDFRYTKINQTKDLVWRNHLKGILYKAKISPQLNTNL